LIAPLIAATQKPSAKGKAIYKSEISRQTRAIIDNMVQALAGDEHWRNIRYLRFDFSFEKASERTMWNQHLWDRVSGDNRIEWRSPASNTHVVVVFNTNTNKGRAWVGEFEKTGAEKDALMAEAQRRHINDVFWLGAPFMLADKRVNVVYEGTTTIEGQDYDVLHARFDTVGLPPGDHYWFFINQATHLVDRWGYFLANFKGTPSLRDAWIWRWKNWQNVGDGLIISTERTRVDLDWKVTFPVITVLDAVGVPQNVFTDVNVSLPDTQPGSH
jgi:hypothetical protein